MFAFYQSVAAGGCDVPDGDMLLFQWGTYDWGAGKYFELNITRQFIEPEDEESVAISQLGLTFRFEPAPEWVALGAANRWSGDQAESAIVREFVFSSPAFMAVADQKALTIELAHGYV
jgi:hypothetical protein